jgi:ubiquinone biosynthesis monooxygenase Coq7
MTDQIEKFIRVNHAGEYGAGRIYAGQLAVLGRGKHGDILREMKAQEQVHLDEFSALISQRRVRPTALLPLWQIAGFALGATTAAMGARAAMACTVAVEEVIDAHYSAQSEALDDDESALRDTIEKFRDVALANEAEQAPGYRLMTAVIKAGCRAAICISEKI